MRVCVLGSGSSGNCIYIASGETSILVDAGLSYRETCSRLEEIGSDIASVCAVCVTHEHSDHRSALGTVQRRGAVKLFANGGTADAIQQDGKLQGLSWSVFQNGQPFAIGSLTLEPFSVPHDSYDPVGFVVSDGAARVGVVTDMGMATELVRGRLKGCRMLILESNHDEDLLAASQRPWSLKQRIVGRQGHLSNRQAGELIQAVAGPELATVFLAHLSSDCNEPGLALQTVRDILSAGGGGNIEVKLTYADRVSDLWES